MRKFFSLPSVAVALALMVAGSIAWAQYAPGTNYSTATETTIQGTLNIASGGVFSIGGVTVSTTAAELNDITLQIVISDISTAGSDFVVSHFAGSITDWYCVLNAVITTADSVLTLSVNDVVPSTGSSITVTGVGSAIGDIDSVTTVAGATIAVGEQIAIHTSGASTTTAQEMCTIVISR